MSTEALPSSLLKTSPGELGTRQAAIISRAHCSIGSGVWFSAESGAIVVKALNLVLKWLYRKMARLSLVPVRTRDSSRSIVPHNHF